MPALQDIAGRDEVWTEAEAARATGDFQAAAELFNRFGNARLSAGEGPQAIEAYEAALSCAPGFARANIGVMAETAAVFAALGQHEDSARWYARVLDLDPANAAFWNHRATELKELEQFQAALEHVDQAEALTLGQSGDTDPKLAILPQACASPTS